MFADEEHVLFTGQPLGDPVTGAALFGQYCTDCHGEDGTAPVGDEGSVVNAEAYLSVHDDAAIFLGIVAGIPDKMTAFAEAKGGPLSWGEVLDLTAFVRSWGAATGPTEMPTMPGVTYTEVIGLLLTERCGACHGGMAGLTVTDHASLMAGSFSGPVVVPGSPDESLLVTVLRGQHYGQLSEAELSLLIEWIAGGALE
jgi:mono/diheme cytochrome c family protein